MAQISEELSLKLGVDQSQVAPELESFKQRVTAATGQASGGFLHVESAGRSFKKVLHEISAESPLMGAALRAAINPITAVILTVAAAFQQFREQQKEAAAESKREAKEVRDAWVEAQEAIYSKEPRKAFAASVGNAAKKAFSEGSNPETETIEGQLGKVPIVGWVTKLQRYLAELSGYKGYEGGEEDIASMRESAAKGTFISALKGGRKREQLEDAKKKAQEIAKIYQEAYRNEDEADAKQMTHQEQINRDLQDRADLYKYAADKRTTEEEKAKSILEISKLDKDIAQQKKEIDKEDAEHKKKAAEESKKQAEALRQLGFSQSIAAQTQFAEVQPTLHELAQSAYFIRDRVGPKGHWAQTPWARQAARVEQMEQLARNEILAGRPANAQQLMFGAGGIRALREQLEGMGLIKPEIAMQKMQEHMATLAMRASGSEGGLVVSTGD
jgi:hypothetical protein